MLVSAEARSPRAYSRCMSDELVFSIDRSEAQAAEPITLEQAGLHERPHLQEWVLANPDIIAPAAHTPGEVKVISTEYDRWCARRGSDPRDRLDVLGLDRSGRLVLAELKRDMAPDSVTAQSLTYAALVSRFSPDVVVDEYIRTAEKRTKQTIDREQAVELLQGHCQNQMTADTLSRPRIVLIAGDFPPTVKQTVVWLTEMGLSISLIRVQAYRVNTGQIVITASQTYPLPDLEDFTVRPRRQSDTASVTGDPLPEIAWSAEDLARLSLKLTDAVRVLMDMCAGSPNELIAYADFVAATGLTSGQVNGALGGLTRQVKRDFARRNWPLEYLATSGGMVYRLDAPHAAAWVSARTQTGSVHEPSASAPEGFDPDS